MSFQFYQHPNMRALARACAATWADSLGVLEPITLIVPNAGVQRWVLEQLSLELGVVANWRSTNLASFLTELRTLSLFESGVDNAATLQARQQPQVWRWRLDQVLRSAAASGQNEASKETSLLGRAIAPLLQHWQQVNGASLRFQYAEAMASVFALCQLHRHDWLDRWAAGDGAESLLVESELWRSLQPIIIGTESPTESLPDLRRWTLALRRGEMLGEHLPAKIHWWILQAPAPLELDAMVALSQHCEVHCYWLAPRSDYLGEVEPANSAEHPSGDHPLLLAWGMATRDFSRQVYGYDAVHNSECPHRWQARSPATRLRCLQFEISGEINLHPSALDEPPECDLSLSIHDHHTLLGEVQGLRRGLQLLFASEPELRCHDVLVLLPDPEPYLGLIDAVFGGVASEHPDYLPYQLASTPRQRRESGMRLLQEALALAHQTLDSNLLRHWLEKDLVLARLEFSADDARSLLDVWHNAGFWRDHGPEARAHWLSDMDEAGTASMYGSHDTGTFSHVGKRLLLGWMLGNERMVAPGLLSAPALTLSEMQAAAKLKVWLDRMERWRTSLRCERNAREWLGEFRRLGEELFLDENFVSELGAFAQRWCEELRLAGASDCSWSAGVVAERLKQHLTPTPDLFRVGTGGITFADWRAMAGVPYRVIAVLGLAQGSVPSREGPSVLSRLGGERRLGDPDARQSDRLRFLHTLLAAEDALYLSFVGRNPATGEPIPPASVVAELQDWCTRSPVLSLFTPELYVKHPLRPLAEVSADQASPWLADPEFNVAPAAPDFPRWQSKPAPGSMTSSQSEPQLASSEAEDAADRVTPRVLQLDWRDCFSALASPARHHLRQTLGVELPRALESRTPDDEWLPDRVERSSIVQTAMELLLTDDHGFDHILQHLRARALLPLGDLGTEFLRQHWPMLKHGQRIRKDRHARFGAALSRELRLPRPEQGVTWLGRIDGIDGGGLHIVRVDGEDLWGSARFWLYARLQSLLHAASSLTPDTDALPVRIDVLKGEKPSFIELTMGREEALAGLERWSHWFQRNLASPIALAPRSAWRFLSEQADAKDARACLQAARGVWTGQAASGTGFGEHKDPFLRLLWPTIDPFLSMDDTWTAQCLEVARDLLGDFPERVAQA